ncbi:MAG: biotin--[acetyl-CoA-carboxylase] ligase, partial [Clostridia bacterium]
ELYNIDLNIKEPNDLLLNNKKICGILTEINTIGEKINYLIISIGFNVNEDNFSTEIKDIAISLKSEFKRDFTREEIIIKFIENLEKELEF